MGDIMYASISNHECREQSRRDDLESCVYMILHMMTGYLPWSNLAQNQSLEPEQKNEKIMQMKLDFLESDYWNRASVKLTHDSVF